MGVEDRDDVGPFSLPHAGPAVVVGGGSGIGAAVAARLRSDGFEVVSWDIGGTGDIDCDIRQPEQVIAATNQTLDAVGCPSYVTITAGVGSGAPLADAAPSEWDRVMDVNAKGVWLAMRAFAGPMRSASGGSIVAVSSVSSWLPDAVMGIYCASKAALNMIVQVAAVEWAPAVRVNAVAPGVTDTPMLGPVPRDGPWLGKVAGRTALGRLGSPDDIAQAVLALHGLRWVTGQILGCDGGLSLSSPIAPLGDSAGRSTGQST